MKDNNAIRYPEIITDLYLCILLIVYPLWVQPGGYTDITEAKYSFFTLSAIIYITAMLLILAELLLIGKSREIIAKFRQFSMTQICILAYVICCIISALLSEYSSKVWLGAGRYEGLKTILLYAALFFLISYFGKFKKWYLYLLGTVVFANTVISVLQYAGYNPLSLFPEGYTYHDAFALYANAFFGTLGNIDILSAFLSLVIPLFYAYYILNHKSEIMLLPFAVGVFLLLLSGVSAGIVGIGIGVFLMIPFVANSKDSFARALTAAGISVLCAAVYKCLHFTYKNRLTEIQFQIGTTSVLLIVFACVVFAVACAIKRSEKQKRWESRRAKKVLIGCVVFSVFAGIAIIWTYPFSGGTLSEVHQLLNGTIDPKLGSGRIRIWQEVIKLIPEHLWFGGGPDTLAERMTFSFQRYDETLGITIEAFIDSAHNDYLNIFVNTGIFSLLFYLAAFICAAVRAVRTSETSKTVLIIMTALSCYLIQIFFSFSICIVSPFFWVYFGLLEAALRENNKKDMMKCAWTEK